MNVKQGDLAIVVSAAEASDAIGHICEVRYFMGMVDYVEYGPMPTWFVRFQHPVLDWEGIPTWAAAAPDHCLRPVSGLPEETDVTTEQPVTA